MALSDHPAAQKLMQAFSQFHRAEWQQSTIGGYRPSEIRVLFCIRKGMKQGTPEMKVSEISKLLHVTSPTVTQLLKGLEANGLVERIFDPADRRTVLIKLTEKGEGVTKKAGEAFAATFNGLIEYLGEEESDQLAELLSKVFVYFNSKEANLKQMQRSEGDHVW